VSLGGHAKGSGGGEQLQTIHFVNPMQEMAVTATDFGTLTKLLLNIILHCNNRCDSSG
jgi:hypothetical protein